MIFLYQFTDISIPFPALEPKGSKRNVPVLPILFDKIESIFIGFVIHISGNY